MLNLSLLLLSVLFVLWGNFSCEAFVFSKVLKHIIINHQFRFIASKPLMVDSNHIDPEKPYSTLIKDNIIESSSAEQNIPSISNPNESESKFVINNIFMDNKFKKTFIASFSSILALGLFSYQHTQPVSNVALLKAMATDSPPIEVSLCNGKPSIFDFYADWCENCKVNTSQ